MISSCALNLSCVCDAYLCSTFKPKGARQITVKLKSVGWCCILQVEMQIISLLSYSKYVIDPPANPLFKNNFGVLRVINKLLIN